MGSAQRREREKQELRGLILKAARELFAERGIEAVTMRAIAERIEYSATAVYLHFKDKVDLLRAVLNEDFELFSSQFLEVAGVPDPLERLRTAAKIYVKFGLEYPNHYRLMFMTPLPVGDAVAPKSDCAEDAYAFLQAMVADAARAGLLRDEHEDLELVCQVLFAGLHGIVALYLARLQRTDVVEDKIEWRSIDQHLELMLSCLIAGTMKTDSPPKHPSASRTKAPEKSAKRQRKD